MVTHVTLCWPSPLSKNSLDCGRLFPHPLYMDRQLEGKAAVVTGGTRGIGRAIAETLIKLGCSVAVCGRTSTKVEQAVGELSGQGKSKVIGKVVDVSNNDSVSRFFSDVDKEFGSRLDILVNNA